MPCPADLHVVVDLLRYGIVRIPHHPLWLIPPIRNIKLIPIQYFIQTILRNLFVTPRATSFLIQFLSSIWQIFRWWQMAVHLGTLIHLVRMTSAPQLSWPRRTRRNWRACKPARMICIHTWRLSRFKYRMTRKILMVRTPTRLRIHIWIRFGSPARQKRVKK